MSMLSELSLLGLSINARFATAHLRSILRILHFVYINPKTMIYACM